MTTSEEFTGNQIEPIDDELPYSEIEIEESEEMRIYLANKYGLAPDTSRDDIAEAQDAEAIRKIAVALGLHETATHEEVLKEEQRQGIGSRTHLALLGLSLDAPDSEIEAAKIRKQQEHHVLLERIAEEIRINRAKNVTPPKPKRLSE